MRPTSVSAPDEHVPAATRAPCGVRVVGYAEKVASGPAAQPVDRAPQAVLAELTQAGGHGPAADTVCGPGQVTAAPHRLGPPRGHHGVRPARGAAFQPITVTDLCIKLHSCV